MNGHRQHAQHLQDVKAQVSDANWGLAKGLLLGSVASLYTVAGAQAADPSIRRTAPVDYVRVCTAHGTSFFYIPGTDTCLRIGGRVRFSYQYTSSRAESNIFGANRGSVGDDHSAYQSLALLNLDARTSTGYGTLRTFIRVSAAYTTGGFMTSGTAQRFATAYPALGQDTFGRAQSQIYLDKAFIQFAGFTAGRAASFFDFYAHDLEMIGNTSGSDVSSTNLFAYTATFGNGWSATVSIEDPLSRRQPLFADQVYANNAFTAISGGPTLAQLGGVFTQTVPYRFDAAGLPSRVAYYDVQQRQLVPDVVGVIRYDSTWGTTQISAAMHELRSGQLQGTQAIAFSGTGGSMAPLPSGAMDTSLTNAAGLPMKIKEEIGWAVQGGLKIKLPQLATGDVLWLQGGYSQGALSYAGQPARFTGSGQLSNPFSGRFSVSTVDSFIGVDRKQHLTEAWSLTSAFLHYWTPEWRSAVFGSYAEVNFGKGARGAGPLGFWVNPASAAAASGYQTVANSSTLRDYNVTYVGANLIWSPVKDLDIGIEGVYTRIGLKNGEVADLSKGSVALTGLNDQNGLRTLPVKVVKYDDVWAFRMRVQRDF